MRRRKPGYPHAFHRCRDLAYKADAALAREVAAVRQSAAFTLPNSLNNPRLSGAQHETTEAANVGQGTAVDRAHARLHGPARGRPRARGSADAARDLCRLGRLYGDPGRQEGVLCVVEAEIVDDQSARPSA